MNRTVIKQSIKRHVRVKCKDSCTKCNVHDHDSPLEYHHIVAVKDGGTNAAENITMLCHDCHMQWHRMERQGATWDGWLSGNHETEIAETRKRQLISKSMEENRLPPLMSKLYLDVAHLSDSYQSALKAHVEDLERHKEDLQSWRVSLLCLRIITSSRWFKLSRKLGFFRCLDGVIR